MPAVATTSKPRSRKRAAIWVAAGLSVSVTVMKTVPSVGSETPAAACALPKAVGKSAAIPITSPVLFISGPSTASAPAKRAKGSTASLTLTWSPCSLGQLLVGEALAEHQPAGDLRERRADRLETNGTVREARGLASIT